MTASMFVILLSMTACAVGGRVYFQRIQMPRPPIGIFTLSDVLIVFVLIVLIPLLYLWLPDWILMCLLVPGALSLVYAALEPFRHRWMVWLVTLSLIGADMVSGFALGTQHPLHQGINNVFVILSIISISNTWAQSGMKARDAAVLAGLLIVYDFIATSQHSLMGDLFARLQTLPLAPVIAWTQSGQSAAIGLGDLLMLTVFPLTVYKGFGIRAGLLALSAGVVAIMGLAVLQPAGIFPVMVVLSPLIIIQYLVWRNYSPERSMKAMYLARADAPAALTNAEHPRKFVRLKPPDCLQIDGARLPVCHEGSETDPVCLSIVL